MAILREYHCPTSLADALRLLSTPERTLAPLAGGTQLIGALETRARTDIDGVVDLRKLDLDYIRHTDAWLHVGAMTTLSTLCATPVTRDLADGLLPRAARGEGPVNLRNVVTVGGIIAVAALDSELYAALLALEAEVVIHTTADETVIPLAELTQVRGLIREVRMPRRAAHSSLARVARTPSDRPIVAALAVRDDAGMRTALCGVAALPVLDGAPLDPPNDVRGSAEYRLAGVEIVRKRAWSEVREMEERP